MSARSASESRKSQESFGGETPIEDGKPQDTSTAQKPQAVEKTERSENEDKSNYTVIGWDDNDPENPYNWSAKRKAFIVFTASLIVVNSTLGSSLPSNAIPVIAKDYNVTSQEQLVLPISVFLIGYVFGPLLWGPLSEHTGRRLLTLATFFMYAVFTMACALAPNWPALLVFRLLCGIFASSPITVVAGILADIYNDPRTRGRAFNIYTIATVWGPQFAPIISGYTSTTIGWRWTFWVALIFAGVSSVPLILLPETCSPILLRTRAQKQRKKDRTLRVVAPKELEEVDLKRLVTLVLARPLRMFASELIVSSTCLYLAFVYAIFYMSFEAYPIIFQDLYGFSPGKSGFLYLPIGGGALLGYPIWLWWDRKLSQARAKDADWVKREEYRRLPYAILGGASFFVSLFWLGFSANATTSFVAPMMAGIPFGLGFLLIFVALLNYLTDAYKIYAASATAIASATRSICAVVLPLATTPMFDTLGIHGACALLGGLSAGMVIIPCIFIWKGETLRARSKFCKALKEQEEEQARKAEEKRQQSEDNANPEKKEIA